MIPTRASTNLKAILVGSLLAGVVVSALAQAPTTAAPAKSPKPSTAPAPAKPSRYRTNQLPKSAQQFYSMMWGVDSFSVKAVEEGEIIRFSYRIVDPAKAKMLNEKKSQPSLIDQAAGVSLVVPSMEKVGQLRQTSTPEAGKVYWMAFSNKGGRVKPGHKVNIVIGTFRVEGLTVL